MKMNIFAHFMNFKIQLPARRMVGSASSNVFENEIRILLGMGTSTHLNVVQLLAYNAETETLVFEYCQHGNLKKFITEHRSHFVDELDDVYASCNNSNRVSAYQEVRCQVS